MSDIDDAEKWILQERNRELANRFSFYVRADGEVKEQLGVLLDECLERWAKASKRRGPGNGSTTGGSKYGNEG